MMELQPRATLTIKISILLLLYASPPNISVSASAPQCHKSPIADKRSSQQTSEPKGSRSSGVYYAPSHPACDEFQGPDRRFSAIGSTTIAVTTRGSISLMQKQRS